ncbi:MAG: 1,4-alpha-glucan branching protein GlgB [Gammaproteobacteria bacterium]|nr:1,4-alpha-glucan branching protein GlgB [Gammaproteobacteria bacterium]
MPPPVNANDSATALAADADVARLLAARHHDPFAVLGRHPLPGGQACVRAFAPATLGMTLPDLDVALHRVGDSDLFEYCGPVQGLPLRYRLRCERDDGRVLEFFDPYCFPPQIPERELEAFAAGRHWHAWWILGAHLVSIDGVAGVRFAVWAPEAERVSVVGDFNAWDGRCHPMRSRGACGVWELFLPGLAARSVYKYEIRNRFGGEVLLKSDPMARLAELRPATASVVIGPSPYRWGDGEWLHRRAGQRWLEAPMSIYEVHLGSWRRREDGSFLGYRAIADQLVAWVQELGFTHVEFLPLTEYPLDESWGYQPSGYFAPTRRFGEPDDLRHLIDRLHQAGIGVILDWVPGHFPRDGHGLARFDGSALYEYGDPRKGEHADWGTLVFNYARHEVQSFLLSSALYWMKEFHFDGLRVDAVASMLYLDYSRQPGEWTANVHGGNENLEAVAFLRRLNELTHGECPGTVTIAEESTAWPAVSRPTEHGGLGFSMKWNMGWMHDTLQYLAHDPVHRRFHHDQLSFGPVYAFTENFVLPLSHDEVVHGKRSLLGRMPGDEWQRRANLRLLYTFQWTYPGKKLLFMGGELAQAEEWDHRGTLAWPLLGDPRHGGVRQLVADLNRLYREQPALHRHDFESRGFQWLRWDDADHSIIAFVRRDDASAVVVALNFTPVPRHGYRLGVPAPGTWYEALNSDSRFYGGSDLGNPLPLHAGDLPWMDQPCSIAVTLPPLAGIVLVHAPHAGNSTCRSDM